MGSPVFRGCHLVPSLLLLLYTRVNGDTALGCYFSFVFILCRLQFKFCIHETTSLWWKEYRLIRSPLQRPIALSTCLAISLEQNFLVTSREIAMCCNVSVGFLCLAHNAEPSCTSRNANMRQILQETFISFFFSPHVREFKAVLDSGFHAMNSGFHSLLAQDYGFHRQDFPVFPYMGGAITLGNISCNFLANLQQIERRSRYVSTLPW